MAIEVTDDLVCHIARLSRIAISQDDLKELVSHFERILAFVGELQSLDTRDVEPSMFSVESTNVDREDIVCASLGRTESLANAPESNGTFFVVPRIVGGGSEAGPGAPVQLEEDGAEGAA